ncbi:MAG: hypothetical protein WDO15_16160 [Bacteroidota bacterium]
MSSGNAQSQNYYNRSWRNNGAVTTNSRSSWTNSSRSSGWGNKYWFRYHQWQLRSHKIMG